MILKYIEFQIFIVVTFYYNFILLSTEEMLFTRGSHNLWDAQYVFVGCSAEELILRCLFSHCFSWRSNWHWYCVRLTVHQIDCPVLLIIKFHFYLYFWFYMQASVLNFLIIIPSQFILHIDILNLCIILNSNGFTRKKLQDHCLNYRNAS